MPERTQEYRSDDIVVTFDPNRCIHATRCIQGLPEVFDVRQRRWVRPENAAAADIAQVIRRCPSGALQYQRLDGGEPEVADVPVTISPMPNGPYYVRGSIELLDDDDNVLVLNRAALCRCGQSGNKPFCDNSHLREGFRSE